MNEQFQSTLIVVPTYNEAGNITALFTHIFSVLPLTHILFVDDGSRDGTVNLIKSHPEFNKQVFILERPCKLGLGTAYITGFKWGLEKNSYQAICQMDADLSHNPSYVPSMLSLLEQNDLVIGSRYVQNGGVVNWGLIRKFISRFGSWYARSILSMHIRDLTGGFNLWRSSTLRKINFDKIKSEGYSFQIELKYRASQNKARIVEYPIVFKDREVGKSKMSLKICIEAFYRVLLIKFSR